jgi:hypothetical protein
MKPRDVETREGKRDGAAFRGGHKPGPETSDVQVRPAGPHEMADAPAEWDEVDEAVDESFPASDPPSYSPPPREKRPRPQDDQDEEAEGRDIPGAEGRLGAGAEEDNNP